MNTNKTINKTTQIFSLGHHWDFKQISVFLFVIALPNLLGMMNIDTGKGFMIHFFQLGVLAAAMAYGPVGGMLAGVFGSIYSAMMMSNPYIIVGNAILGFTAGYLMRIEWNAIVATLIAFIIQIPFLIISDHYFIGMPLKIVGGIIISLLVSNMLWSTLVHYSKKPLRGLAH